MVLAGPDDLLELANTAEADLQEISSVFEDWDPRLETQLSSVENKSNCN